MRKNSSPSHPILQAHHFPILGDHLLQWFLFWLQQKNDRFIKIQGKTMIKLHVCFSTDFSGTVIKIKKKIICWSPMKKKNRTRTWGGFGIFCSVWRVLAFWIRFGKKPKSRSERAPWRVPLPHVPSLPDFNISMQPSNFVDYRNLPIQNDAAIPHVLPYTTSDAWPFIIQVSKVILVPNLGSSALTFI